MTNASLVTHDELKRILDYDPESGVFVWKVDKNQQVKIGDFSGWIDSSTGYKRICINGTDHKAHRLAWFYVYGKWPKNQIDHVNGVRDDNRICNLREATRSENGMNRPKPKNNTSGYKGVSWHKRRGKWQSYIYIETKRKHLGYFDSPEEAYEAYCKSAKELHGEFANV